MCSISDYMQYNTEYISVKTHKHTLHHKVHSNSTLTCCKCTPQNINATHGWSAVHSDRLLGGAGGWDNGPGGLWLWEGRGQENTSSCRDIIFIIRCPSEVLEKHVLSARAIIHLGSCSKRHGEREREEQGNIDWYPSAVQREEKSETVRDRD